MSINLIKGEKISLKKENGTDLTHFCVGANWGVIESIGFLGIKRKVSVDLDLSIALFDAKKILLETIYYGNLSSTGIRHSGDDLTGDFYGNDNLDNEVISLDLKQLNPNAEQVVFILNSYKGQDFSSIPFATIRLFEGNSKEVNKVIASYQVASEAKFAGFVSLILAKLYQRKGEWKFSAIGEPSKGKRLTQVIDEVAENFL